MKNYTFYQKVTTEKNGAYDRINALSTWEPARTLIERLVYEYDRLLDYIGGAYDSNGIDYDDYMAIKGELDAWYIEVETAIGDCE